MKKAGSGAGRGAAPRAPPAAGCAPRRRAGDIDSTRAGGGGVCVCACSGGRLCGWKVSGVKVVIGGGLWENGFSVVGRHYRVRCGGIKSYGFFSDAAWIIFFQVMSDNEPVLIVLRNIGIVFILFGILYTARKSVFFKEVLVFYLRFHGSVYNILWLI